MMKEQIKAYYQHTKGVISLIVYTGIYSGFLQVYMNNQDIIIKRIALSGLLISGFFLLRAFKRLLQKKYKGAFKKFDNIIDKFFRLLKQITKKVASRFGFGRNRVFIKGTDKVEFIYGELKKKNAKAKEKQKRQKLPKWDELTTNRERIRYIYAAFLYHRKKHGYIINSSMTPADISKVYAENELQLRLFECYTNVRYDDDKVPVPGSMVKELLPIIKK